MSRLAWLACLSALMPLVVAGCADNAMVLKNNLTNAEKQNAAMNSQLQQLQDRAVALDRTNQDLNAQLAQNDQQVKVSQDQLDAMRDQLRTVATQLAQARSEKESTDKRVKTLTASMQRQGGVMIEPNNSFLQALPAVNIPGVFVRRDGDVIRIELPGNSLFESGSARLTQGAANLISQAAAEIARTYPDQIIGVEGHTDVDPATGNQWSSAHQLSVSRALTVYNVLVSRTRLQGNQLFVLGHGPNRPLVSNATTEGRQRNRRVELVIYPERKN